MCICSFYAGGSAERTGQRPRDGKGEGPRGAHHARLDPGNVSSRHRPDLERRQLEEDADTGRKGIDLREI